MVTGVLPGYCLGGPRCETSEEESCEELEGANSVRNGCGSLPAGTMPAGSGLAALVTLELTVSAGEQKPHLLMLIPCMPSRGGMFMPWQCSALCCAARACAQQLCFRVYEAIAAGVNTATVNRTSTMLERVRRIYDSD